MKCRNCHSEAVPGGEYCMDCFGDLSEAEQEAAQAKVVTNSCRVSDCPYFDPSPRTCAKCAEGA